MGGVETLKVTIEPRRVLVASEPYVVYTSRGYAAALDVVDLRKKREYRLFIGAASLSKPLHEMAEANSGRHSGLEFWLRKEGDERTSRYVVEE